jgi:hypothetical protein
MHQIKGVSLDGTLGELQSARSLGAHPIHVG